MRRRWTCWDVNNWRATHRSQHLVYRTRNSHRHSSRRRRVRLDRASSRPARIALLCRAYRRRRHHRRPPQTSRHRAAVVCAAVRHRRCLHSALATITFTPQQPVRRTRCRRRRRRRSIAAAALRHSANRAAHTTMSCRSRSLIESHRRRNNRHLRQPTPTAVQLAQHHHRPPLRSDRPSSSLPCLSLNHLPTTLRFLPPFLHTLAFQRRFFFLEWLQFDFDFDSLLTHIRTGKATIWWCTIARLSRNRLLINGSRHLNRNFYFFSFDWLIDWFNFL